MKKTCLFFVLMLLAMPSVALSSIHGDVDGDGEVGVADLTALIDYIFSHDASTIDFTKLDVDRDGEINVGDVVALVDVIMSREVVSEDHDYIDLGLPSGTLWATYNLGATSPEEYGDYYAWGETAPKEGFYNWGTYKWSKNGSGYKMTKYCTDSYYGTVDSITELELADDAAYVNWGPSWRMPSSEQLQELLDNCTWQWTTVNGVYGRLVTGPNGNTLFLPATGFRWDGTLRYAGERGGYWSRTLDSYTPNNAGQLWFYWANVQRLGDLRSVGWSVRAVRVEGQSLYIVQRSLDLGVASIGGTCSGELTIVNTTSQTMTLTATTDTPFSLIQEEGSSSSMTIVVPGNSRTSVTVMFTATEPGEFNGNVTFQNTAFNGGQRVFPVMARGTTQEFPQHEYVDLGLASGTLWATMNVGASSPEEIGDHFAWGETAPKEVYDWTTYKWCNGTSNSLTKYCINGNYGTVDNKDELEPADDAAFMNWGPSWRMPSEEQMDELRQDCSWQWTSMNGVDGRLVTGPNGNTIFLPTEGSWQEGIYWTRSLFTGYSTSDTNTSNANAIYFDQYYVGRFTPSRCVGYTVRAVLVP